MFTPLTISLTRSIFLMIIGLGLIGYGLNNQHKTAELQNSGQKVLSQPIQGYKEISNRDKKIGYLIEPTFLASDGKTYICKAGIDENTMNQLKQNSQIEITYNPKDPTVCEVKNAVINDTAGSKGDFDGMTVWAGGILALIGSILSLIKFLSIRKNKK